MIASLAMSDFLQGLQSFFYVEKLTTLYGLTYLSPVWAFTASMNTGA